MNDIRAVALRDADRDFGLRSLFSLAGADDGDQVIVCVGDTGLEHLPLDYAALKAWARAAGIPGTGAGAFLGVAVYGDLAVSGWIVNGEQDAGPFLWVRGDVRAGGFATAGSEIRVEGALEVARTFTGTHERGRTTVRGDTDIFTTPARARPEGASALARVEGASALIREEGASASTRVENASALAHAGGASALAHAEGASALARVEGASVPARAGGVLHPDRPRRRSISWGLVRTR